MSHTLSGHISGDFLLFMDKENLFNNITNGLSFPAEFPYEFASPSSTESESDDDDVAGLTRRFSRSASLQEPFCNFKEKRGFGFSGSPESTLGWSVSGRSQAPSPPPLMKSDEEAWNLIYAAGQVARMRMNNRGLLRAPTSVSHCSWRRSDGEEFFRQPQFSQSGGCGCGGSGGSRPASFHPSVWPAPQLQNHRSNQHKPTNFPSMKPVVLAGSGGGCDGGAPAVKKECAGTGVFLPRRYCNTNNPPESRKRQACSSAHLPARMIQPANKNMDAITTQAQASINGGFVQHSEMLMGRRNAMILAAQQRRSSNIHGGAMEAPANNPEMLLPQEWTY